MHRITQKHSDSQGINRSETVPAGTNLPKNDSSSTLSDPKTAYTKQIHETAYSQVVQTQRVIVIPRYFIEHWLPLLGPSRAWLVIAFRQAAFVARSDQTEVIKPLSIRQLKRWSGLSHGQIWNLVRKPQYLRWFVRDVSPAKERVKSTIWGVQTTIPVAPHHLSALEAYIQRTFSKEINDIPQYLRTLLKELPVTLWECNPDPDAPTSSFRTVHQLVEELVAPLTETTSLLCDEITARITHPGNALTITHYFIDRWRGTFKCGEAWLVQLLRAKIYASGSGSATAFIEGGKKHLAAMLGVTPRSMRRWFEDFEANPLRYFLSTEETVEKNGVSFVINQRDPIHPCDQESYEQALNTYQEDDSDQGEGQKWTASRTKMDRKGTRKEEASGQKRTALRSELDKDPDNNGQREGQKWTHRRTKPDRVIVKNKSQAKTSQEHPQQQLADSEFEETLSKVEGGGGWPIDKLLQSGGISPEKRKSIYEKMRLAPRLQHQFIAWLMYGYAHLRGEDGTQGITAPVLFTLSRYTHSLPEPVYLKLAKKQPAQLVHMMQTPYGHSLQGGQRRVLKRLERNGFPELLDLASSVPSEPTTGLLKDDARAAADRPQQEQERRGPIESGIPLSSAPASVVINTVPAGTVLKTSKPVLFPSSAENFWREIQGIIGFEPAARPVSMWLNDRELEVSLMGETDFTSFREELSPKLEAVKTAFPGCMLRLRAVQVVVSPKTGLPGVETLQEEVL